MLLDRPHRTQEAIDPPSGPARERDLAAELARIMARAPRRGPSPPVLPASSGSPSPRTDAAAEIAEAGEADDAPADPAEDGPETPPPAWARSRRSGRLARNARMVGASLIAVMVVAAIVAGTAFALFGSPSDVAAIKQLLLPAATSTGRM